MAEFANPVYTGDATLGAFLRDLFKTRIPDPEKLVFEYVRDRAGDRGGAVADWRIDFPEDAGMYLSLPLTFDQPPALSLYEDGRAAAAIPVRRGWPTYPGKVPQIGVAAGTTSEDSQNSTSQGEFAGDVGAYDDAGVLLGSASYYSEALYTPVVVELIHENRDERDRLHHELRRLLTPLRRKLPARNGQIRKVTVDDEKQEFHGGPPEQDKPFVVYISVFTVHVHYELLEAVDVAGADRHISGINITLNPL